MTIFDALTFVGGLCLFLFGMSLMGSSLERRAGGKLQSLLGKLTTNKIAGLFTGIGVTSIIQSSSATTVMVVGFVNSGLMTLKQSINVIMGANIGTTVTAWILSLGGITSDNVFLKLLKPSSFTPVLALFGIILFMFFKKEKHKQTGMIFLGFAVLMFGMETMTTSVSGLANIPAFQNLFILFKNPLLGVIVGAILTAVIQSSSASVGVLQALAATGAVSYGAAIPIIMGQNIGTCITAILSSFGTNRNAKRAAVVHLSFNIIGTAFWLAVFYIVQKIFSPIIFDQSASLAGIAIAHSAFNILCTLLLLPMSSLLEKLAVKIVPDSKEAEVFSVLDERLLATPSLAIEVCRNLTDDMGIEALSSLQKSLTLFDSFSQKQFDEISESEEKADKYEDAISTYLVKLSTNSANDKVSIEAAELLKVIGDFERISDHAVNLSESALEMNDKKIKFTPIANKELNIFKNALTEILELTGKAFIDKDLESASSVEPLEQIIDDLKNSLRSSQIQRMQSGKSSVEEGFIWSDILTNMERTSDHCSNIAACVIDSENNNLNMHASVKDMIKNSSRYKEQYNKYKEKYFIES